MTQPNSKWTPVAVVLGFFLVMGSLEALSFYVATVRSGRPMTAWALATAICPSLVIQIALAWPVSVLSRRARLGPGTWHRSLPIHIVGALVFAGIVTVWAVLVVRELGLLVSKDPLSDIFFRNFIAIAANQIAVYGSLVGVFHALEYLRESEQRERERARLELNLADARLNALRSQLSPHFFFNTLNAISTFALQGRREHVGDMVGALGELMRASLDERLPHEVPLWRELELLDLYLDIQRVRFADWLRIEREVQPEALDVLVPSLMLQPLVENVIEHGGSSGDDPTVVRIRCRLEGADLAIDIENPTSEDADAPGGGLGMGVGLRNTKERLEQLHPGEHSFRFGAVPGGGFVTAVRLRARHATPSAAPDPAEGAVRPMRVVPSEAPS